MPLMVSAAEAMLATLATITASGSGPAAGTSATEEMKTLPQVNVKDFEGFDFYATPSFLKDLPVPFWFVKSTFENDEANVIMKHRDVKVSIGSRSFVIGVPFISNLRVTM